MIHVDWSAIRVNDSAQMQEIMRKGPMKERKLDDLMGEVILYLLRIGQTIENIRKRMVVRGIEIPRTEQSPLVTKIAVSWGELKVTWDEGSHGFE